MKIEDVLDLPEDVLREALELVTLKEMAEAALLSVKTKGTKLPDETIRAAEAFLEDFENIRKESEKNQIKN